MNIPFVDRPPTEAEIERFRLFLSSYQDRLGNYYAVGEPVFPWLFKEVLVAAFNIPDDEPISPYARSFGNVLVNREGMYMIHLKSLYTDEQESFCKENMTCSFVPSRYWDYVSQFGITQQNYKENPSKVGIASLELLKSEEKTELEKVFFLFLLVDRRSYPSDTEQEICFHLAQYPHALDLSLAQSAAVHWLVSEEPDPDERLRLGNPLTTLLRGYKNDDLLFEIKIPEDEPAPLPVFPSSNRKKQKISRKSLMASDFRALFSDSSIQIRRFLHPSQRLWQSNRLQLERLSSLQIMEYGAIAAIKKQREQAIAHLEALIHENALEEDFQQLLAKNWWMFGNEYGEIIRKRELSLGTQQDFIARRTADGFLEIIEIKRPLQGKKLIYKTDQENRSRPHYCRELSDAIAQVIDYTDKIESEKYSIYFNEQEDVGKIRAKIIIGRDADEEQKRSLRNLNSALHGIEILTYDQLLRVAKKSLEYQ